MPGYPEPMFEAAGTTAGPPGQSTISNRERPLNSADVAAVLRRHSTGMMPVVPFDLRSGAVLVLDLTAGNTDLSSIDYSDSSLFSEYIFGSLAVHGSSVGIGRYDEDRVVYRHSSLFGGGDEPRSVHVGIDLFVAPGTPVSTPLEAAVHSLADNSVRGDYGPTVILEHCLDGVIFYTLYGHLCSAALDGLAPGLRFGAGELIGHVGEMRENGGWPPHLHLQVIADIGNHQGNFPGVARPTRRRRLIELCPDPNLILGIPELVPCSGERQPRTETDERSR